MSGTERYRIEPDGTVVTVYTDTVDLRVVGHIHAVRASVVEWDESGQAWTARILATGKRLGPFATRAEAVSAERAVLATQLETAWAARQCEAPEPACQVAPPGHG
jgi:hypothetical protein